MTVGMVLRTGALGTATFSVDGLFRYRLTRRWAPGGLTIAWAMKNPSLAGADNNDMTVTKCIGYSKVLGGSALVIGNLGARISTDPKLLLTIEDPVGAANEDFLKTLGDGADKIVAAWGGLSRKEWKIFGPSIELLKKTYQGTLCLGMTQSGDPKHPSRLAYATAFQRWP